MHDVADGQAGNADLEQLAVRVVDILVHLAALGRHAALSGDVHRHGRAVRLDHLEEVERHLAERLVEIERHPLVIAPALIGEHLRPCLVERQRRAVGLVADENEIVHEHVVRVGILGLGDLRGRRERRRAVHQRGFGRLRRSLRRLLGERRRDQPHRQQQRDPPRGLAFHADSVREETSGQAGRFHDTLRHGAASTSASGGRAACACRRHRTPPYRHRI